MTRQAESTEFQGFLQSLIGGTVNRIIGKAGITRQDRDDLQQELFLRVWGKLPAYDPRRGPLLAFVRVVLKSQVWKVFRNRLTKKQGVWRARSLPTEDGLCGPQPTDWKRELERIDLAIDMAEVLATLPESLREVAEQLKVESVMDISRNGPACRSTVYQRVRQIRKRFERQGLQIYLQKTPHRLHTSQTVGVIEEVGDR